MFRLLILENDADLGSAIVKSMTDAGFDPHWLRQAGDATDALARESFALFILDIQLPDGTELLQRLRARNDTTPVLILTEHDGSGNRVQALQAGTADYLTKPFALPELVARVHAVIRRGAKQTAPEWRLGELRVNPARRRVSVSGQALRLSPREYCLLLELARQAGQVVPRARLEFAVFQSSESIHSNSLEVHMCNLRRKLGRCAQAIRTVHGVGYMLDS